jgi:hypothetical protein
MWIYNTAGTVGRVQNADIFLDIRIRTYSIFLLTASVRLLRLLNMIIICYLQIRWWIFWVYFNLLYFD